MWKHTLKIPLNIGFKCSNEMCKWGHKFTRANGSVYGCVYCHHVNVNVTDGEWEEVGFKDKIKKS